MKAVKIILKVIGFTLLAVFLVAVLGIVGLFFYLKTSNFDTEKRSLPTASRSAEHYQNGFALDVETDSLVLDLTQEDVMWLLEYSAGMPLKNYIEEKSPVSISISDIAIRTRPQAMDIYGDGTLFGFLTVHVRIEAEATWNNGKLWVSPRTVSLGNKIILDSVWLADHGIVLDFSSEISEDIKTLILQDSGAAMTMEYSLLTFGMDNLKADALQASQFCYLFRMWTEAPRYRDMIDAVKEEMYGQPRILKPVREVLAKDGNVRENLVQFMGMATQEREDGYLQRASDFTYHFLLDGIEKDTKQVRDAFLKDRLAMQKPYEEALRAAKALIQSGDVRVEKDRIIKLSTGETVTAALLEPAVTTEGGGLYLLVTGRSAHPVKTDDMPGIRDLTFAKGISTKNYPDLRGSAGLLVTLPSGDEAICYYLYDGTFVVNAVSEEYIKANIEEAKAPRYLLEDAIPKPSHRPMVMPGSGEVSDLLVLDELAYLPSHLWDMN